jgi:hypothetical protein
VAGAVRPLLRVEGRSDPPAASRGGGAAPRQPETMRASRTLGCSGLIGRTRRPDQARTQVALRPHAADLYRALQHRPNPPRPWDRPASSDRRPQRPTPHPNRPHTSPQTPRRTPQRAPGHHMKPQLNTDRVSTRTVTHPVPRGAHELTHDSCVYRCKPSLEPLLVDRCCPLDEVLLPQSNW